MRILLFNPENDLALASNDPHYTPPASARRLAADLAWLPLVWARPGDVILYPDGSLRELFPCAGQEDVGEEALRPMASLPDLSDAKVLPWGWSPLLLARLQRLPLLPLPSAEQVQQFRRLAGRATSREVLTRVRKDLENCGFGSRVTGETRVCTSTEQVRELHASLGETMLKQPWSGSGRGLHPLHDGTMTEKDAAWARRTLREQKHLMAEPIYNKVEDLAVEFWCHEDGGVTYEGLSLFHTTGGGVYAGNMIAREETKRKHVAQWIPMPLLDAATEALRQALEDLDKGFYAGPVGVDMMIVQAPGTGMEGAVGLHPCVEVNWRMTMGWVALQLVECLEAGQTGQFSIEHEDGHYMAKLNFC